MTNKDKYLKDGVDINDFVGEFNDFCAMQTSNQTSIVRLAQFLSREVKPTLTEDEKVILNRIRNFYTHIKRTNAGLKITSGTLGAELGLPFNMFDDNLFQFIQPRRRI